MASLASLSTKISAESGAEISILHPVTDLPLGILITVHGSDSKVCKEIQRRQTNHRLEVAAKKGHRKKPTVTAEQLEAEMLDLLVGCTKGWRTLTYDENGQASGSRPQIEFNDGEWLDCTPENARRVYEEISWIREQIDAEIADRDNFLQSSPTN